MGRQDYKLLFRNFETMPLGRGVAIRVVIPPRFLLTLEFTYLPKNIKQPFEKWSLYFSAESAQNLPPKLSKISKGKAFDNQFST